MALTGSSCTSGEAMNVENTPVAGRTPAEERAQRLREKNRRAQVRLREKAKSRDTELKEQAAELAGELERVLLEKKSLELQMQAMARQKEEQEALLTDEKERPFVPSQGLSKFSPSCRGGLLLNVACNPPRRLTHKQVMELSVAERLLINQEMVGMARQLLELCPDKDPHSEAGKKLVALIKEKHGLVAYLSGHNATLMHRLFAHEDGSQGLPPPTAEFWATIRRRMGLSKEQKRYLNEARCRLLYNTDKLMQERVQLQSMLKDIEVQYNTITYRDAGRCHVLWAQIAQALRDNCDKEHVLYCRFYACIWLGPQGMTPFQEAQMMVDAHPHYPDMLALLEGLEEDLAGQPLLLDADEGDVQGLDPRNGELPDPTVEQYKPLELKLVQAIFNTKLFIEHRT